MAMGNVLSACRWDYCFYTAVHGIIYSEAMNQFTEPLKEFFRTVILGMISTAITMLLAGINTVTGEIHVNWALLLVTSLVTLLTGVLRFIDKWSYTNDKPIKLPF